MNLVPNLKITFKKLMKKFRKRSTLEVLLFEAVHKGRFKERRGGGSNFSIQMLQDVLCEHPLLF
jgi:hypothetical protein